MSNENSHLLRNWYRGSRSVRYDIINVLIAVASLRHTFGFHPENIKMRLVFVILVITSGRLVLIWLSRTYLCLFIHAADSLKTNQ